MKLLFGPLKYASWLWLSFLLVALSFAQDIQLPDDYSLDLQLASLSRSRIMQSNRELLNTPANQIGGEVFARLVSSSLSRPYPWKLTLVDADVVNASSTAGGQVYVFGGILPLIGHNQGLWAAVLSHEVSHTVRRHQVRTALQILYNERMVAYYKARIAAGDKQANWGLVGFQIAAPIALKRLEREQEHDADEQGMLLMARSGYHPDFIFALHHLLLMKTGEQSKFAAFFSDHPRWETRDQRSAKEYSQALAEFNQRWPDAVSSPGGIPPVVAFLGQPHSEEDKQHGMARVTVPMYCRNSLDQVDVVLLFSNKNSPVPAADPRFAGKDGSLAVKSSAECVDKDNALPIVVEIPAVAVKDHNRSINAEVVVVANGNSIAESKWFDVHFPKSPKAPKN